MVRRGWWGALVLAIACGDASSSASGGSGGSSSGGVTTSGDSVDATSAPGSTSGASTGAATTTSDGATDSTTGEPPAAGVLEVKYLGVGGVALRYGDDTILTAPLWSNPSFTATTFGDIAPDPALVDAYLPLAWVEPAKAILVGHAHYDHLLDVPYVWTKTDDAIVYGNQATAAILSAFPEVPASRVAVLNDPAAPLVDRRSCAEADACTGVPAGIEGAWIDVPDTNARIRALCSMHPAQFLGVVHFGEGCMTSVPKTPPTEAGQWLEGSTLAYLVDFLGDDGSVAFRVYYQDAPTDAPLGHPDPVLLEEHRVDLAIVNVGSYDAVRAQPEAILEALQPRYVLAAHWENFFVPLDPPCDPIPFHPSPVDFDDRALATLGEDERQPSLLVDGRPAPIRYLRPQPGAEIVISAP